MRTGRVVDLGALLDAEEHARERAEQRAAALTGDLDAIVAGLTDLAEAVGHPVADRATVDWRWLEEQVAEELAALLAVASRAAHVGRQS